MKSRLRRHLLPSRAENAIHLIAALMLLAPAGRCAEVIPPKPERYFNDYAGIVSQNAAMRFNEQLAQFERETSNQILVAIWSTMPSQSSIEDFTQRAFQAWAVGQKGRNNGAVLFVFVNDRRMRIQPGYGLEGALPDFTCDEIIRTAIAPHFRNGDYEGGLAAGIDLIFKAIRGEYKGTGKTVTEQHRSAPAPGFLFFVIFVVVLIVLSRLMRRISGYGYSSRRGGPVFIPMGVGGGGGWSSGGGGFSGFSGGGGLSGGGGASGSW